MTQEQIKTKLIDAEERFINEGLLKFHQNAELEIKPELSLIEFLEFIVSKIIPAWPTYNLDGSLDTDAGKHRSIEDIFRLTKYYKPEVTLELVAANLCKLAIDDKIYAFTCPDIEKFTFFKKDSRDFDNNYNEEGEFNESDESLDLTQGDIVTYFTLDKIEEINNPPKPIEVVKPIEVIKEQPIMIDIIAKRGGYRPRIRSRHPSHDILRTALPKLKVQSVFRLGSTTPVADTVAKGGRCIEVNSVEGVKNSSSKRLMKECFTDAGIQTADWFTWDGNNFTKHELENNHIVSKEELKFPIIQKQIYASRGEGNTFIQNMEELNTALARIQNPENYIWEIWHNYSLEFRIHVSIASGCFYTCRKALKKDTPEHLRFQKHDDNSVWFLEDNPEFKKPVNWEEITQDCVNALHALGLDIAAFDVLVQSGTKKNGNARERQDWRVLESCSAASFGNVTAEKYIEEYPKVVALKAQEAGLI